MKKIITLLFGSCLLLFAASTCFAQMYTVTDLGPLSPTAINTWGQVVGNLNNHAFIWTRSGGLKDLGLIPGGTFSRAAAINDLGVVVGTGDGIGTVVYVGEPSPYYSTQQCSALTQPFVWTRTKGMQALGSIGVPGIADFYWCSRAPFYATGINALGEVVGYTGNYSSFKWAFRWTKTDGMSLLGGGWPPTHASAIANTGQIVGQNGDWEEGTAWLGHATSWMGGVATDLGTIGGTTAVDLGHRYSSSAAGVNDLGQVVGWSNTSPVEQSGDAESATVHAVMWTQTGQIRDLGTLPGDTLSAVSKINLFGQVIGSSGNSYVQSDQAPLSWPNQLQVNGRPFIWTERSGMRDLNTLITHNSGWVLNTATDINVWGQIVGAGTRNGQQRGFLLTPRTLFQF